MPSTTMPSTPMPPPPMPSPPMDLILVRHAVAHERDGVAWPDDSRRPLTEQGIAAFERMAKRLGRVAPPVELVESSSFERAWATARILRRCAGWPKPQRAERLELAAGDHTPARAAVGPSPSLQALARSIAAMRGLRAVAWVGHEPMLSRFASLALCGSAEAMSIDFRKGAALVLRFEALTEDAASAIGSAQLLWMLTPQVVRRMRKGSQ